MDKKGIKRGQHGSNWAIRDHHRPNIGPEEVKIGRRRKRGQRGQKRDQTGEKGAKKGQKGPTRD